MIAVCCDHGGLSLKQEVLRHLEEKGLEYKDFGTNSPESCDYPDIVKPLCRPSSGVNATKASSSAAPASAFPWRPIR